MRLWHPSLLQELPPKTLSALHMSICKVRSNPWGKPTPRAWYYNLSWRCLVWYHSLVIKEMQARGWHVLVKWLDYCYRGKGKEPSPAEYEQEPGCLPELEAVCPETPSKQREKLNALKTL